MSAPAILWDFPHTIYHPEERLVTWHPRGIFDSALYDRIVEFIEEQERLTGEPFDRYTDLEGISEVRLHVGHAFRAADRRRASYQCADVRSAIFAERTITLGLARLYEQLMHGSHIEVRAFESREAAAQWLGVPVMLLAEQSASPSPGP